MKKGTSLEKQAHPWKQPRETPKPAGGLTLPAVPRFWRALPFRPFKRWLPARWGSAWLSTPHSSPPGVGRWSAFGPCLPGLAQPTRSGGKLCSSEQWSQNHSHARWGEIPENWLVVLQDRPTLGCLSQGDARSFLGALQGKGAAAERTWGTRKLAPSGAARASGVPSPWPPRSPLPFPRPAQASPWATVACSISGCPGHSGDSEHHLFKALEGGFAQGSLWTIPDVQL